MRDVSRGVRGPGAGRERGDRRAAATPRCRHGAVCRRAETSARRSAVLDAAVLRGRKRREFEAWRDRRRRVRPRARWRDDIPFIRGKGQPVACALARVHRAPGRAAELADPPTEAYIDVLRAGSPHEVPTAGWAHLHQTTRTRARVISSGRRRNTLALAFGSWEQALGAAGLGARRRSWRRDRA